MPAITAQDFNLNLAIGDSKMESTVCSGCRQIINTNRYLSCMTCNLKYDLECSNVSLHRFNDTSTPDFRNTWKCPSCKCTIPKRDNSDTPIRAALSDTDICNTNERSLEEQNEHLKYSLNNITMRKNLPKTSANSIGVKPQLQTTNCISQENSTNDIILSELRNLRSDIKTQFEKQETRLDKLAHSIDELNRTFVELNNKYLTMRGDIDLLDTRVEAASDERDLLHAELKSNAIRLQELEAENLKMKQNCTITTLKLATLETSLSCVTQTYKTLITSKDSSIGNKIVSQLTPAPTQVLSPATALCTASPPTVLAPDIETATDDHDCNGIYSWQTVTNRKSKLSRQVVKGNSQTQQLQTVERTKQLHACFFKPDTTPESIKKYMEGISAVKVNVLKLKLKHENYASFMLTVPESKFELFMTAGTWPVGTEVSEWFRRTARRVQRPRQHPAPGRTTIDKGVETNTAQ